MPRTVDPRRLQKKTSQTMLAAQRRGAMEGNRLAGRLAELQAEADWGMRNWGRDYRQAEQQLSLANLVLSDHVIDVGAISGGRPRAPSAEERRRKLAECLDGGRNANEAAGRQPPRGRRRRPASVFGAQLERQRQLQEQKEKERQQEEEDSKQDGSRPVEQRQPSESQPLPQQQPQAHPVPCLFAGSGNSPCRRFPCCLPQTYSFLSNKREMLQLYDLLLSHLPPHKSAASEAASDLGSMISDAEYLIGAQQHVSTLDPVERSRLLRQSVDEWKRRHSRQAPQPRETRYGKPYPMRTILKPISCSTSFFLS